MSYKVLTDHKDYRAVKRSRFFNKLFIFLFALVFAIGMADYIFTTETETDYLSWFFLKPNSDNWNMYYREYKEIPIIFSIITLVIFLFHFIPYKWKITSYLEKIKQFTLNFIPLYFSGNDKRNIYIRFGFSTAIKNNFLERKVSHGNYLTKKPLSIFTGEYSPNKIFSYKNNILEIEKFFLSQNDFLELFMIIEGYLSNLIEVTEEISFHDFFAFGRSKHFKNEKAIKIFIKKVERDKKKRTLLVEQLEDLDIDDVQEIKEFIESFSDIKTFKKTLKRMVVFSPLALKGFLERVYIDSTRYYKNIKKFDSNVYIAMLDSYPNLDEKKIIEITVFLHFYKIINLYMGLPSGIITARAEDYSFKRIVDDFEHFSNSLGIRQIKKGVNDALGEYDDRFARAFMIFYHEYTRNSQYSNIIKTSIQKFNPIMGFDEIVELEKTSEKNLSDAIQFGNYNEADGIPDFVKQENYFEKREK